MKGGINSTPCMLHKTHTSIQSKDEVQRMKGGIKSTPCMLHKTHTSIQSWQLSNAVKIKKHYLKINFANPFPQETHWNTSAHLEWQLKVRVGVLELSLKERSCIVDLKSVCQGWAFLQLGDNSGSLVIGFHCGPHADPGWQA